MLYSEFLIYCRLIPSHLKTYVIVCDNADSFACFLVCRQRPNLWIRSPRWCERGGQCPQGLLQRASRAPLPHQEVWWLHGIHQWVNRELKALLSFDHIYIYAHRNSNLIQMYVKSEELLNWLIVFKPNPYEARKVPSVQDGFNFSKNVCLDMC